MERRQVVILVDVQTTKAVTSNLGSRSIVLGGSSSDWLSTSNGIGLSEQRCPVKPWAEPQRRARDSARICSGTGKCSRDSDGRAGISSRWYQASNAASRNDSRPSTTGGPEC